MLSGTAFQYLLVECQNKLTYFHPVQDNMEIRIHHLLCHCQLFFLRQGLVNMNIKTDCSCKSYITFIHTQNLILQEPPCLSSEF